MFVLSEMQDIIRIEPWKFNQDTKSVIVDTLNSKLANKVTKTLDNQSSLLAPPTD